MTDEERYRAFIQGLTALTKKTRVVHDKFHTKQKGEHCPFCKIRELEMELDTAKSAYSDLLVNSGNEIRRLEARIKFLAEAPMRRAQRMIRDAE